MTPQPQLLFHTVRYLRAGQLYHRLLSRLPRSRIAAAPAPGLRSREGSWLTPVEKPRSLHERWRLSLLNEPGEIQLPEHWNAPKKSKLWLYNLHYFDDLMGPVTPEQRALQRELLTRWIAENPIGSGNGWEPYPCSLRIANWIKWALGGEPMEAAWLDSLAMQTRWLSKHIEWHLLGNHLLANAKALTLAGLFFDGTEAELWLTRGLAIYERELSEQILADGGHFELSPMYHAILLEDLLDVLNAARTYGFYARGVLGRLPGKISSMRAWLAAMTHPDGKPSFFNDSAFGIAASRATLETYAHRLGLPPVAETGAGVHWLASSGYMRVNVGTMSAILDLAAIGPDYNPGHAHADTLSFEYSLGTERIIVNGGTSTYTCGTLREAQRATRAHSTVEIDGENSSEVWASFRVARRARVRDVGVRDNRDRIEVVGTHDGYTRLAGRPLHKRSWTFTADSLTVYDEVQGGMKRGAVARFHLEPGVRADLDAGGRSGHFHTPGGRFLRWNANSPATLERVVWYPEFGKSLASMSLVVPLADQRLSTTFNWPL